MKSRAFLTPLSVAYQHDHRSHSFPLASNRMGCIRIRRQRRLLLGASLLLILWWTIGAIWLIGVRRGERSPAEVLAQRIAITALFPEEMKRSR